MTELLPFKPCLYCFQTKKNFSISDMSFDERVEFIRQWRKKHHDCHLDNKHWFHFLSFVQNVYIHTYGDFIVTPVFVLSTTGGWSENEEIQDAFLHSVPTVFMTKLRITMNGGFLFVGWGKDYFVTKTVDQFLSDLHTIARNYTNLRDITKDWINYNKHKT